MGTEVRQDLRAEIRRRQGATGDKWHLDEVMISIAGKTYWLWRAVDQHGVVLDILVQSRRDARAAKRLLQADEAAGADATRDDHRQAA